MCQQQATASPGSWDGTERFFILSEGLEPILSLSQVRSTSPMKLVPWNKASSWHWSCLPLPTPWHSFQCALFSFDFFFYARTNPFSLIFLNWYLQLEENWLPQHQPGAGSGAGGPHNPASAAQFSPVWDEYPSWHILGWGGMRAPCCPPARCVLQECMAMRASPGSCSSEHRAAFNYPRRREIHSYPILMMTEHHPPHHLPLWIWGYLWREASGRQE